ncbi:MAG TPA: RluA family pseudouridine synthase [Bacillota bacterium]|nr:RluA family pseudouridine synthase [Bacillota bacterium]
MQEKRLYITENDAAERLDLFLAHSLQISRSFVGKIFDQGDVRVNGKIAKPSQKTSLGSEVVVVFEEPVEATAEAEEIPLDIAYEDGDLIVINKPRGMVVHPAAGNPKGTLVNALLAHCGNMSSIGGVLRPGIVHRIDKDTSGLLVIAKNDRAHLHLAKQFHDHSIERVYIAVVHGVLKNDTGTITGAIGRHPTRRKEMAVVLKGRRAVTHYRVLEQFPKYAVVEAKLETGRTHQIRVHFSHIGHPLVGDPVYGRNDESFAIQGQALHAMVLGFEHPGTGAWMRFETPLPEDMLQVIEACRKIT